MPFAKTDHGRFRPVAATPWRPAILLVLVALLFALPGPLRAQISAQLDDHIATLINQGRLDDARAAIQDAGLSRADRFVFEGRVLKSQGDHAGAIGYFRAALDADPAHIFARRELAHSLFQTGRYRAARHQLLHLIRTDKTPRLQPGYRALLRRIEEERPFRFGLQFAIEPSTNINRGSYETLLDTAIGSFEIDDASRAQSGFGVTLGANGNWRRALDRNGHVTMGWMASRTVYPSHDTLNRTLARIELGYGRTMPRSAWRIAPYVSRSWTADGSDMTATGLTAQLQHRTGPVQALQVSLDAGERRYDTATAKNGPYAVVQAGIDRQVGRGVTLNSQVTLEHSRPETAAQAYDGIGLKIGARAQWRAGIAAEWAVFGGMREFRGVFPLTTITRADRYAGLSASITLTNRQIGGFAPRIGCSAHRNRSNIGLYSYDAQSCSLTFESLF